MWEKREKNGLTYYTLPAWENAGANVVMTTRFGGVSKEPCFGLNLGLHVDDNADDVVQNRRMMLEAMDSSEEDFVTLKQVHGNRILKADSSYRGRGFVSYEDAVDDTDGVFTTETHVLMATFYADCLPLAVFHPGKKILGLAHAGWKGTYQNIGGELISAMRKTVDFDPSECWCALGAGIGSCCYEVDESFYQRFCERYEMADDWFIRKDGAFYFDNVKANTALFIMNGVKKENIEVLGLCTACHNDMFFSYRKEHGQTGRHGLWGELI